VGRRRRRAPGIDGHTCRGGPDGGRLLSLKEQPANFKAYDTPEFGDQVFVRAYRAGQWGPPIAITGPHEDIVRCAIAAEASGTVWVVYSAHRQGKHRLYTRALGVGKNEPGPEQELPNQDFAGRNVAPVACTDRNGGVRVAYQTWTEREAQVGTYQAAKGQWEYAGALRGTFGDSGNSWSPALTAGSAGVVTLYDSYNRSDYDIMSHTQGDGILPLVASARFEARPAAAFELRGRLWVASEEGPTTRTATRSTSIAPSASSARRMASSSVPSPSCLLWASGPSRPIPAPRSSCCRATPTPGSASTTRDVCG
jgi:hypothetical protein